MMHVIDWRKIYLGRARFQIGEARRRRIAGERSRVVALYLNAAMRDVRTAMTK